MKNNTIITEKLSIDLYKAITKYRIFPIIYIYECIMILFIAYTIYVQYYLYMGLFIGVSVLLPIAVILYGNINSKKIYKKYRFDVNPITYQFTFEKEDCLIKIFSYGGKSETSFKYTDISKVINDGEYYLIFCSNKETYILSKLGFDNLIEEEFENLFKSCGKKIKVIKK